MNRDEALMTSAIEAAEELGITVVEEDVQEVSIELLRNVVTWVTGADENMGILLGNHERPQDSAAQREIKLLKAEIEELKSRELSFRQSVARRRNVDVSQVELNNSGDVLILYDL